MIFAAVAALAAPSAAQNACTGLRIKNDAASLEGGKVVGGWDARPEDWPGFVSLRIRSQDGVSAYFCAGTAIHPRWVVTAAHCVYASFDTKDARGYGQRMARYGSPGGIGRLEVIGGFADLAKASEAPGHPVRRIVVHPGYRRADIHSDPNRCPEGNCAHLTGADIALLEIEPATPLPAGNIGRIALEAAADPPDVYPSRVMVAGFGRTSPWKNELLRFPRTGAVKFFAPTDVLQETAVPTAPTAVCRRVNDNADPPAIGQGQICAGDELLHNAKALSGRDTCGGDSGGPLVYFDRNKCPYVIGLTSWGSAKCGHEKLFGVYTRVSAHADWILSHVPGGELRKIDPADLFDRSVGTIRFRAVETVRPVLDKAISGRRPVIVDVRALTTVGGALRVERIDMTRTPLTENGTFRVHVSAGGLDDLVVFIVSQRAVVLQLHPSNAQTPARDRDGSMEIASGPANWTFEGGKLYAVRAAGLPALGPVDEARRTKGQVRDAAAYLSAVAGRLAADRRGEASAMVLRVAPPQAAAEAK